MPTRRTLLSGLIASAALPHLTWADAGDPAVLACAQGTDGGFQLAGLSSLGAEVFRLPLPARGHAGAAHPARPEALVCARRPGTYALVIDAVTGQARHRLSPPIGRHFNGHATFLDGGALLATVEQRADTSEGRIGLWDATAGYRRIGDIASGGIGPHDMRLMPDGETLVVANGGIATDATDRTKLNIATMRPNLAYLRLSDGLVEVAELPPDLAQNSIRHLVVRDDGLVAFAMQWEGGPDLFPPLLGLHRQGTAPVQATLPDTEAPLMANYGGSVAFSGGGDWIALASPRGGRVQRFGADGVFRDSLARADACGLATLPDGVMVSDGGGGLVALTDAGARPLALHPCAWDNHLVALK